MNNPQAFPSGLNWDEILRKYNEQGVQFVSLPPQLTIADYFAAKAMQSLAPNYWDRRYITGDKARHISFEGLAVDAYDAAEAMLKEREKRLNK